MEETTRDLLEDCGNRLSAISECLGILAEFAYKCDRVLSGALTAMSNSVKIESEKVFEIEFSNRGNRK